MKKMTSLYDRSRVSRYVQVATVMRQRIDSGYWKKGEKISTLEVLEQEFGVGRVTVRQAVDLLRNEGLLIAQQGRGTFVSGKPEHDRWLNISNDFDTMVSLVRDNVLKKFETVESAPLPQLSEGEGKLAEAYVYLRSVQYNDDEPFSFVRLHLAQHIFDKDREFFTHGAALPKIVEMEDVEIVHAYQTLMIGVAGPETAELLGIGLGEPTADCRLVLVDSDGIAIYIADINYNKNCFAMRVDLLARKGRKAD